MLVIAPAVPEVSVPELEDVKVIKLGVLKFARLKGRREVSYVERDNRGPAERVGDRVCRDRDNAKRKGLLGKAAEVLSFIQAYRLHNSLGPIS